MPCNSVDGGEQQETSHDPSECISLGAAVRPRAGARLSRALGARRGGVAYEARLIGPEDQTSPDYRALQPFGQVPAYEEDGLALFEFGAIVLHIAERSEALMPSEPGCTGARGPGCSRP